MIDLHMHFDGSLLPETIFRLAAAEGRRLPEPGSEAMKRLICVPESCTSLNQYLKCFALPLALLQSPDAVRLAMEDLVTSLLGKEGMQYVELRFAPSSLTAKGASQEEILCAAVEGLRSAEEKFCREREQRAAREEARSAKQREVQADAPGLEGAGQLQRPESTAPQDAWVPCCRLILCCMRGTSTEEQNLETIRLADQYRGREVAAIDLAGPEDGFPLHNYRRLFTEAQKRGLPCTIHAGEAAGPENIREAVEYGAARIGHGISARRDPALMELLAQKQIPLECCPVSNVQTHAVESMAEHPVRPFLHAGIRVTVNTDNRTVSGTDIPREYRELTQHCGLTAAEKRKLLCNAADAAFLAPEEREKLKKAVSQGF